MRKMMIATALVWAGPVIAQDNPAEPRIDIVAVGTLEVPPEKATIRYSVRGEGATADEATRALVARKDAVEKAISRFGGGKLLLRTGTMQVLEVRGPECRRPEFQQARISTGACAVQGHVADMAITLTLSPVEQAGTLTGLIAQAGGSGVTLSGFALIDPTDARRKATALALSNGKLQAEAIAAATGARLGPLVRVTDADTRVAIANDTSRYRVEPDLSFAAVPVSITPEKVTVNVQLSLSYALLR